jgi:hypothetical protein
VGERTVAGDIGLTLWNGLVFYPLPGRLQRIKSFSLTEPVAFRSSFWHRRVGRQEPVRMRV